MFTRGVNTLRQPLQTFAHRLQQWQSGRHSNPSVPHRLKWTHCRGQNTGKISKIIENHRHSFSRNRPQPALHNRDSGEVVGHYRNGYNELIHRKELVPSGTVSDKHLHT